METLNLNKSVKPLKPQLEQFIREYLKALKENYAAIFAGAGLFVRRLCKLEGSVINDIVKDLNLSGGRVWGVYGRS